MKGITLPICLVLALSPALAQLAFVLPMTSFSARHSIQGFNNKNAYHISLRNSLRKSSKYRDRWRSHLEKRQMYFA